MCKTEVNFSIMEIFNKEKAKLLGVSLAFQYIRLGKTIYLKY